MKGSRVPALRRLADEVLEVPDLDGLTRLLTRSLPEALAVGGASLLLWDRKLESFEGLAPEETRIHAVRPGGPEIPAPNARYLLSDGEVLETPTRDGEGTLVPLMARSGLVGMLVLGGKRRRQGKPLSRPEARPPPLPPARPAPAPAHPPYPQ